MSNHLEELKKDLIFQLSFEDIDWDYFKDTLDMAVQEDKLWNLNQKERGQDDSNKQ